MPNNARTQTDGTWVTGYEVPQADFEDLERKIFEGWNGDRGGAYCAPIVGGTSYVFGGAGVQITSRVALSYGGAIYGGPDVFVIPDGTWPKLVAGHVGRTRSIVQPILEYYSPRAYLWSHYHPWAGVGSVALAARKTTSRVIETPELYVPLEVVDGATLTKVALHFRVAERRRNAPMAMPRMRILRVHRDPQANAPAPLRATSDGTGFDFLPLVASPEAWYADGQPQVFEYVCDQNNVIDLSLYSYLVHILEEKGAETPEDPFDGIRFVERKADVLAVGDNTELVPPNPPDDGPTDPFIDGIHMVDGDRILLATKPTESGTPYNGLWIVNTIGEWTRAKDLDEQEDFTPNWIVVATQGRNTSGSAWQCQYPSSVTKIRPEDFANASGLPPDPGAMLLPIQIKPAEPKGNIYHSLVPTFELTDLRFQ